MFLHIDIDYAVTILELDCIVSAHTTHMGGGYLHQAGQAIKDALRHARQLVRGQIKVPVGMADMS